MTNNKFLGTPAMQRQHLLVEFTGLKDACPQGVFVSLSPGDPSLWTGVIFVKTGPYAPAILRFQVSFPPTYPSLPPLITFSTDIFHPLVTPLTTYMYTTDIQDSGTVSATDDERLPPGGFSLRHGFPNWFGRASKSAANSRQTSGQYQQTSVSPLEETGRATLDLGPSGGPATVRNPKNKQQPTSTYDVLRYICSTFDNAEVLDGVPLEAAGNPGAWHAWRSHRIKSGKLVLPPENDIVEWNDGQSDDDSSPAAPEGYQRLPGGIPTASAAAKKPGEWNWEGVWELRVKRGIDGSLAEPVLYGNVATSDDLIRFLSVEEDQLEIMKKKMRQCMEVS